MNYTILKNTIDSIMESNGFYQSIIESMTEEGTFYKDLGFSFYFKDDEITNVDTEQINTIKENWKIEAAFVTAPENYFERLTEAREAAKNIRADIANISPDTLLSIADPTNNESIQITPGNITHDSKPDGSLIMTLTLTITLNQ